MALTTPCINFLLTGIRALCGKKKKRYYKSGARNVKHALEAFYHTRSQGNYQVIL